MTGRGPSAGGRVQRGRRPPVLTRLLEALHGEVRKGDQLCNQYLFEVAEPDSLGWDPQHQREQELWTRALQMQYGASYFHGVDYLQPDVSGADDPANEVRCYLMTAFTTDAEAGSRSQTLADPERRSMTRKQFLDEILWFMYHKVYGESYGGGTDQRSHSEYVADVYLRVKKTVGNEVELNRQRPAMLRSA